MAAISIWKDTYYQVPASASPFSYTISVDGNTIYSGKAFVAPNEQYIKIKVNTICQDYLMGKFPGIHNMMGSIDETEATRTFTIHNSGGTALSSYTFTNDWSYDITGYTLNYTEFKSHPINLHKNDRMCGMYTQISSGNVQTTWISRDYTSLWPSAFRYKEGYCGDWALYYQNAYGGWDAFLVEGNVKRNDEMSRLTITTPFNNNTTEWGKRNYNTQINPSFEIKTGYLTDTESAILAKNLLRSNQVYLHDLNTNKVWPVILTDTEAEWKTFKGNGRKFITYTINATASQTEQNIN